MGNKIGSHMLLNQIYKVTDKLSHRLPYILLNNSLKYFTKCEAVHFIQSLIRKKLLGYKMSEAFHLVGGFE